MSSPSTPNDESTFEDAMQRLDEIVSSMEDNRLPLESMISSYEEGVRLLAFCRQRIEVVRHRVELINANADGTPATLTPFGEDSLAEEGNGYSSTSASSALGTDSGNDSDTTDKLHPQQTRPQNRRRSSSKPAEPEGGGEIRLF